MSDVKALREPLESVLADYDGRVGGAVVAVAVGDDDVQVARGCANLNTRQPFTTDTGWLLGSVTKVVTTALVLRFVDRGTVDLDAPVVRYLPDFRLATPGAAEAITVRMLLNHTNAIDADTLFPAAAIRGRDAAAAYQRALADCGVLFEPGRCLSYSNPGFVLAARILEELEGKPYEQLVADEVFGPVGMRDATAVQIDAMLRSTAVGAILDPDGSLRASSIFTMPESGAAAGTTPIVTVSDMLAFGRMLLREGKSPSGTRVLSSELVEAMWTPTAELGVPHAPPMGLGLWRLPIAGTLAGWHGGSSPGGSSSFCILPEHDAVIVSFAAGYPYAKPLNDALHRLAVTRITGNDVGLPFEPAATEAEDISSFSGEYRSFQSRIEIETHEDGSFDVQAYYEFDEEHQAVFPDAKALPRVAYAAVAPGVYGPVEAPLESYGGLFGRMALASFLPAGPGHPAAYHSGCRFNPKAR